MLALPERRVLLLLGVAVAFLLVYTLLWTPERVHDVLEHGRNRAVFETELGAITFAFFPHAAPLTVAQFEAAIASGYFDGCSFYRCAAWETAGLTH